MRIAYVIHDLSSGGAESLVSDLSKVFVRKGHGVDVVLLDKTSNEFYGNIVRQDIEQAGVRFVALNRIPGHKGVAQLAKLWWLVQRNGYDIVHSHLTMPDIFVSIIRMLSIHKFAHVSTVHSSGNRRRRIATYLTRKRVVVYCSDATKRCQEGLDAAGVVIYNGINITKFSGQVINNDDLREIRKMIDVPISSFLIITVGRLIKAKHYECVIKAIEILKKEYAFECVQYIICGDGPERGKLEEMVLDCDLGDCVYFLGVRTDISVLLQAADIYVSTSIYEGHPIAVLEALASGIVCVLSPIKEHMFASDIPYCIIASENSPEIIAQILNEKQKTCTTCRSKIIEKRQRYLESYSIENCAGEYERLYEGLVNNS